MAPSMQELLDAINVSRQEANEARAQASEQVAELARTVAKLDEQKPPSNRPRSLPSKMSCSRGRPSQ